MDSKLISKIIKKVPEAIGVGIGMGLLSMLVPYAVLNILAPNYELDFNSLFLRWSTVCVVISLIYYWDKERKADLK
ncbi:MAG: hypothetical protein WC120_00515 [Parcubacteria group bacterium]